MRAGQAAIALLVVAFALLSTSIVSAAPTTNTNCLVPVVCPNVQPPCLQSGGSYDPSCFKDEGEFTPVPYADSDRDGVIDCPLSGIPKDNCLCTANANQADANGNGVGDACETSSGGTISITKEGPATLANTQSGTYMLTVTNTGARQNVKVHDSFSTITLEGTYGTSLTRTGTPILSPSTLSHTGSVFSEDGLTLTNFQGTAYITYKATAKATSTTTSGIVPNTAQAVGEDGVSHISTHTTTVPKIGTQTETVSITKSVSPSRVTQTGVVTYTISVSGTANQVTIVDDFAGDGVILGEQNSAYAAYIPNTVTFSNTGKMSGLPTTSFTINNLAGTETITYQARVTPGTQDDVINNEARLVSHNGRDDAALTVPGSGVINPPTGGTRPADFTIIKGVTNRLPRDRERLGYSVQIRNIGDLPGNITLTDTIGTGDAMSPGYGTLIGTSGGFIRHAGGSTEQVVARDKNNRVFYPTRTGSIAQPNGVTLFDIPGGATVTFSYQGVVDTTGLGAGVQSFVDNTASIGSRTDTVRVTLMGRQTTTPTTSSTDRAPTFLPIPNQILTCGNNFPALDLTQFIQDDNISNTYRITVSNNRYLQASVTGANSLTVTDPVQNGPLTERLQLTLVDDQGRTARQTVTYSVMDNIRNIPLLKGIPDQIIESGDSFSRFRLSDYVQVGTGSVQNFYAIGSELFSVRILNDSTAVVEFEEDLFDNPDVAQISEAITFGVIGCREAEDVAVFTVVNEDLKDLVDDFDHWNTGGGSSTHTCAIKINNRLYDDYDCDAAIDLEDNCPFAYNPTQADSDRNGVGNACDITVSCEVQNQQAVGGQTVLVDAIVQNNMDVPATGVRVRAQADGLGVTDSQSIQKISAGESDVATLKLRLPACSLPGKYKIDCSAITSLASVSETDWVTVGQSNVCSGESDGTLEFYQIQDVLKNEYGGAFPITIKNDDSVQRTYMLKAEGVLPWGDYVFESGSVVVVPAGQQVNTQMRVFASPDTPEGEYPFTVEILSGKEQERVVLVANVVSPTAIPGYAARNTILGGDLVWLVIVLVFIAAVVVATRMHKKPKNPKHHAHKKE